MDIRLIPFPSHSRGLCAVAIALPGERWLMHCGDVYAHRNLVDPSVPFQPPPRFLLNIPLIQGVLHVPKRGRKRLFNEMVYRQRFTAERTFAWTAKFKRLLIRFARYDAHFLGAHYLAFAMINLRHVIAQDLASENPKPTSPPEPEAQC